MKQLILMRHAKSDWSMDQSDKDRPLNPRGQASATTLGDWMRRSGHRPDEILCSSAARTRETCALLALDSAVRFLDALYLAPPEVMFDLLKQAQGDTVLMIGHNPGIAECASQLVANAPDSVPDHDRFFDYPTGATLVAQFDIDTWAALTPGTGRALDFVTPRGLAKL